MCRLEPLNPGAAVTYLPHSTPGDNCLAKIKKLSSSSSSYKKVQLVFYLDALISLLPTNISQVIIVRLFQATKTYNMEKISQCSILMLSLLPIKISQVIIVRLFQATKTYNLEKISQCSILMLSLLPILHALFYILGTQMSFYLAQLQKALWFITSMFFQYSPSFLALSLSILGFGLPPEQRILMHVFIYFCYDWF